MVGTDASICMLLDGPITHDGQSQRTVRTLSTVARVLVVTTGGSEGDQPLFDEAVGGRPTVRPALSVLQGFFLLPRQNDHLAEAGLADGRTLDVVWANDYSTLVPALRIAHAT